MNVSVAYQVCEEITRREARNFYFGIRLLPERKRQALCAVYAMARRIDDIGDGALADAEKLRRLATLRESIARLDPGSGGAATANGVTGDGATANGVAGDAVLVALADAAARFPLPLGAFGELLDGCRADVTIHRYDTFEALVGYCRCVAGSVGRLSTGVYAPADLEHAWPLADALGIALQLTNILRDLREDRLAGRIYLPEQDLRRFGCELEPDDAGRLGDPPERFAALVRFEADRAQYWYERGLQLLPLLDRRSAACTAAIAGIYRRLLQRIADDPEPIRAVRVSVPTTMKLAIAGRALARGTA